MEVTVSKVELLRVVKVLGIDIFYKEGDSRSVNCDSVLGFLSCNVS